jgi:signal transduction histidine kinase
MESKLFAKYNRINVLATIAIFLIASVAFFFTVKFIQIEQVDDDLKIEEEEIVLYVERYGQLPKTFSVDDQMIQFIRTDTPFTRRYFNRTDLRDMKGHLEDFRQLFFGIKAGGQWYMVTVSKSLEETDDLVTSVFWITSGTILLILIASFVINRFVFKQLWKPFYDTLFVLKHFKIDKEQKLDFPSTTTEEFRLMIDTLESTTVQAQRDYLSLKSFSENASHEMQTPIAIIQSKLDLLIQDEALIGRQSKSLHAIYEAIDRLTRLNSSLLLLVKIENRQFSTVQTIDLKSAIEQKVDDFQELWQAQHITVNCDLSDSPVSMNKDLSDVLINNLLSNATKHNVPNGTIGISLQRNRLSISNSGNGQPLDEKKVFQRFYKPSQSAEHNGLGLSIIFQICEVSGLHISYKFKDGQHQFLSEW